MLSDPKHTIERIAGCTRGTLYEGRIYAVGGFLRDQFLGRPWGREIDFVVEGNALDLAGFLFGCSVARHPPVTYPRFGTAMLQVGGVAVELVSARSESYQESSRKPEVSPADIHTDALRRDFTINTLLQEIHSGELIDPTGRALSDLAAGLLRTPLDPEQTFHDDPLRMLRAIRFAAQLGFLIDPEMARGIIECGPRLAIISQERIRDEWTKILTSPRCSSGLRLLRQHDLLPRFLPEVSALSAKYSGNINLWDHTLSVLDAFTSSPDLGRPEFLPMILAACLHHPAPPRAAVEPLFRLRYSSEAIKEVLLLLELRLLMTSYETSTWSDGHVRRLVRRGNEQLPHALQLWKIDQACGDPDLAGVDLLDLTHRVEALESVIASKTLDSPLSGNDIMELLGLGPGVGVREAKEWLLNEVLEGRLRDDDTETAQALLLERAGRQ